MANLDGEESFEAALLGQAEEVILERICDDELILIKAFVFIILYFTHSQNLVLKWL